MKRLFVLAVISASLVGCATPQQNAALAGAIVGATVMSATYTPPPVYQVRPVRCTYIRGGGAGYDLYGNPMFKYHKVCS